MTLAEILGTLRHAHIELQPVGDSLRFGPANLVSGTLRIALAEHKTELLAILQGRNLSFSTPEDAPAPGEWVRTPAGAGELIGWNEDEALIQLFAGPSQPDTAIPRLVWMRAEQMASEFEAFGKI